jgi:predicted DNA-binding ribbon-helix-helix protein
MIGLLYDMLARPPSYEGKTMMSISFGSDSAVQAKSLASFLRLYLKHLGVRPDKMKMIYEIEAAVREGRAIVLTLTCETTRTVNGSERIVYVCLAGEKRNNCVRVMRRAFFQVLDEIAKKREECVIKLLCRLAEFDRSEKRGIELAPGKACVKVLGVPFMKTKEEIADEVARLLSKCPPDVQLSTDEVRARIADVLKTCATPEECAREVLLRHPLPDGNKRASLIVGLGMGLSATEWCRVVRESLGVPCRV